MRGMNLVEVAKQVMEEEWRKIRIAKIEEIGKLWDDLFFIRVGEEVFKKDPGVRDYASFEEIMRQHLEKARQKDSLKEGFVTKPPSVLMDELGELLQLDYSPPNDVEDISFDLIRLKVYYNSNLFFPSIERVVDLSLCKLIRSVCKLCGAARARGETILTGRKKQQEDVASSRTAVCAAFNDLGIKNKPRYTSKLRIASDIKNFLISKNKELRPGEQKNIPSVRTIIRYLESDVKVQNDLIAMGVIKDKPTPVQ
jgi:hypothetical protein